ncbi:MAG: PilZ domain-containing protein [Proteobacteria bacterium]|nr:PilZ domain-containing protein [Pseudomonadota bacterium]
MTAERTRPTAKTNSPNANPDTASPPSSPADRRATPRLSLGDSTIIIAGRTYPIRDISASGIAIQPYDGQLGERSFFPFILTVADAGVELVVAGEAIGVRREANRLAAKFFHILSDGKVQLDRYFERKFRTPLFELRA